MSFVQKAADVVHKGIVLGLVSFFGFQLYQIGKFTYESQIDSPHMKSTYFKDVHEKVKEEAKKDNLVDYRDFFDEDDDSYLKDQVRPNLSTPEYKKKLQQQQQNTNQKS